MDLFEKINRSFGTWYEGLFGGSDDVRPKDILRRILAAMEDHRKEGFDNKIYVPNQYVLEINVQDEEEREYLLSFLDRAELEAAIRRYCQQNHYHVRGPLDFTIKEVEEGESVGKKGEKFRVRCRYNTKITGPEPPTMAVEVNTPPPAQSALPILPPVPIEERTIPGIRAPFPEEGGTIPSLTAAVLIVYGPDRSPYRYPISRPLVRIGRSVNADNDLVISGDGQISKRHCRIERDQDGIYTITDMESTNGTKVNGRRVDNRILHDGDEIIVGVTRLIFQNAASDGTGREARESEGPTVFTRPVRSQGNYGGAVAALQPEEPGSSLPPARILRSRTARLVLLDNDQEVDDFLLASETTIGRGVTNDIVLPDRSVGTRHARIGHDGTGYKLEGLDEQAVTTLNGATLLAGQATPLQDGDRIGLGNILLRFDSGTGM